MKKRIFALAGALCMTLSMAAASAAEKHYIGVSIFDYSNNFVGYIRNGIDYYVKNDKPDVKYLMVDGENNQATQTERIDTMIARGVQAIAVNPVDSSACETIVQKARDAGIPVVFFNRMPSEEVLNSYDKCYYVGSNVVYQGELEGQMVADAWAKDAAKYDTNGDGVLQYVLLKGTPGHSDAEDRANGFYAAIEASGIPVEELAQQNADWNTTKAKDAMALGAVEALRANGLITDEKMVPVIGVNGLPEVSNLIESGVMLGSVLTSPYGISQAVIDLCINAIDGKPVTEDTPWELENGKIVRIPETKITIENVNEAVDAYKLAQ